MKLQNLKFIIENPSGTYKKFADSLDQYPILGVTYPTHYGYIEGYVSEDGHNLDVFIGNGTICGLMKVNRNDVPGGIETKFIFGVNEDEISAIEDQFMPVIHTLQTFEIDDFLQRIAEFKH